MRQANQIDRLRERHGLGRRPSADERDKQFPLRMLVSPMAVDTAPASRTWPAQFNLDQGSTPQCVAYAWTGFLLAAPTVRPGLATLGPDFMRSLYHDSQARDEWEGDNYDGTSVRGGAKALQEKGFLQAGYHWAQNAAEARDFVRAVGCIVLGVNWYERMFLPDGKGFLLPEGEIVGGHAILSPGYSAKRNAFRLLNSWGREWGEKGRAWIHFEHVQRLIAEDGECCSAVQVKAP